MAGFQPRHAELAGDLRAHLGADRTVRVPDVVSQLHLLTRVEQRAGIGDHLGIQRLWYLVAALQREIAGMPAGIGLHQQRVQIHRLEGGALSAGQKQIISEPVLVGSIQVPPGGQPAFLLIARGDALHSATVREVFTRIGESALKENLLNGNIIENVITGEQFDLRLQFPSAGSDGDLRCQHRFIKGDNDSYLLAACAPDRQYRQQAALLFNILSSFQPLN